VKAGLAVLPSLTLRRFRLGAQSDNPVYLVQRERIIEGMRLAGVPEGWPPRAASPPSSPSTSPATRASWARTRPGRRRPCGSGAKPRRRLCAPLAGRLLRALKGAGHQMPSAIASNIMRTTLDIEAPILREVKALHEREGRSMGAVVSELLAEALARRRTTRAPPSFRWTSRDMRSLVDLSDKEAVYAALDAERP